MSASIIGCCITLTVIISIVALVSSRVVITDTAFLVKKLVAWRKKLVALKMAMGY
jgi:hypothetical protein